MYICIYMNKKNWCGFLVHWRRVVIAVFRPNRIACGERLCLFRRPGRSRHFADFSEGF